MAVDRFRDECFSAINTAKISYLTDLGRKLNNPETGPKAYWKVLNKLLNKCNIPKIPPLLSNNKFIINCKEKARMFNDYFLNQSKTNINDSNLPDFYFLTDKRLENVNFTDENLVNIINSLNPNKSTGPDNISV